MKLQFSLATLLVCMTVLAVVTAVSIAIPINENPKSRLYRAGNDRIVEVSVNWPRPVPRGFKEIDQRLTRAPNGEELAWRIMLWAPMSMFATFAMLWTIRRLKSRLQSPLHPSGKSLV